MAVLKLTDSENYNALIGSGRNNSTLSNNLIEFHVYNPRVADKDKEES